MTSYFEKLSNPIISQFDAIGSIDNINNRAYTYTYTITAPAIRISNSGRLKIIDGPISHTRVAPGEPWKTTRYRLIDKEDQIAIDLLCLEEAESIDLDAIEKPIMDAITEAEEMLKNNLELLLERAETNYYYKKVLQKHHH